LNSDEPTGTPEQLQIALDASIEANQRKAAERLLFARNRGMDLTGSLIKNIEFGEQSKEGCHNVSNEKNRR